MRGGSLLLGWVFGVAFCAGASCTRPGAPVVPDAAPHIPVPGADDIAAMTCTLEQIDQTDENVALVCVVPRDLSEQLRRILEGRGAVVADPVRAAPKPKRP